jgi:hypothetical protein
MKKIKLSQSATISAITTFIYILLLTWILEDVDEGAVLLLLLIPILFILFMIYGLIFPLLFSKTKFMNNIYAYILSTILFEYLLRILSIIPFINLDHFDVSSLIKFMFDLKSLMIIILLGISYGTLFWLTQTTITNKIDMKHTPNT